jgi:hypothetical protein
VSAVWSLEEARCLHLLSQRWRRSAGQQHRACVAVAQDEAQPLAGPRGIERDKRGPRLEHGQLAHHKPHTVLHQHPNLHLVVLAARSTEGPQLERQRRGHGIDVAVGVRVGACPVPQVSVRHDFDRRPIWKPGGLLSDHLVH